MERGPSDFLRERQFPEPAELFDDAEELTADQIAEIIGTPDSLREILDDEELAPMLADMVADLPKCIKELSEQMGRAKLPEYERMLQRMARIERVLIGYAQERA